jgi:hypothetical protein
VGNSVTLPADAVDAPAPSITLPSDAVDSAPKASAGDHVSAFFRGLSSAPIFHPIDAISQGASMLAHPIDTVNQAWQGHEQSVDRALQSFKAGQPVQGVIHEGLSLVPFLGPAIDQHYQEMKDAEAKGDTVGMTEAAGKIVGLGASGEVARRAPDIAAAVPDAANAVADAASKTATFTKAAAMAGGKDAVVGAAKTAGGAELALKGGIVGQFLGVPKVFEGAGQIYRGAKLGIQAGKDALSTKIQTASDAASEARAAAIARVTDAFDPATAPHTDIQLGQPPIASAQQMPGPQAAAPQAQVLSPSPIQPSSAPAIAPSGVNATNPLGAKPNVIPFAKPEVASAVYEAAARSEKAQKLAQFLHTADISYDDAKGMDAGHWQLAAKGAGVNAPSVASQGQAMFELKRLEASQPSPQLIERLNQTGAMPAAQQLQQMMGQ